MASPPSLTSTLLEVGVRGAGPTPAKNIVSCDSDLTTLLVGALCGGWGAAGWGDAIITEAGDVTSLSCWGELGSEVPDPPSPSVSLADTVYLCGRSTCLMGSPSLVGLYFIAPKKEKKCQMASQAAKIREKATNILR